MRNPIAAWIAAGIAELAAPVETGWLKLVMAVVDATDVVITAVLCCLVDSAL